VVFEAWVETCLVSVLQSGQVVILGNATFHKGGRIQHGFVQMNYSSEKKPQLVELAGARLLYLSPYFPDLNKMENC